MAANISRTGLAKQYAHVGYIGHGDQSDGRLEITAPLDGTNGINVVQGSVVSLNKTTGNFVLGCAPGTAGINYNVPMISMKNAVDPDVATGTSGATSSESTYSAVGGDIVALPVTGSYEIETSEYDSTKTYNIGDALVAEWNGTVSSGLLVPATAAVYASTVPVVGFVSHAPAVVKSAFGTKTLGFICSYFPEARS